MTGGLNVPDKWQWKDEWKKAVAVLLGALWAHLILNASEEALTSIIPFLQGSLTYQFPIFPWR